jgi:putative spermidine/putrescine transport system permease protein
VPLLTLGLAMPFVLTSRSSRRPHSWGQPWGSTRVISTAAYDDAFQKYDYSMGSAIALMMGVVELAVIVLVLLMRGWLYRGPSAGGKG